MCLAIWNIWKQVTFCLAIWIIDVFTTLDSSKGIFVILQAEATVIHQCTQLLSPPDDPTYVMTYISLSSFYYWSYWITNCFVDRIHVKKNHYAHVYKYRKNEKKKVQVCKFWFSASNLLYHYTWYLVKFW